MAKIRPATRDDLPDLILLADAMHRESRYRVIPFDAVRSADVLEQAMGADDGCVIVAVDNFEAIGFMAGGVGTVYFSSARFACDYALYVKPEWRGRLIGKRLIHAFLAWTRERGVAFVDIGISSGVCTERTGKLYESEGLRLAGALYSTLGVT